MRGYLLIDGNSISHAANNATPLKVGEQQVQAIYGVLRTMRRLLSVYADYQPIVLWDGMSWRKTIFSEYKANRDKVETIHEKRMALQKDVLTKQKPAIEKALSLLGIAQLRANNMEADDLGAILADRYRNQGHKVVLVTGDRDWIQLVDQNVVWFDPINDRKVTEKNFEEFTGVLGARQFVELKALMGDAGDNIEGVGGIGDKGAVEFLNTYGTFANFSNMALDGSLDVTKLPKKYRALAEDEGKRIVFSRNIDLIDLRTRIRPRPEGMNLNKGEPSLRLFKLFCQKLMFRSILEELDNWLYVFPAYQDGRMLNDQQEAQSA